MPKGKKLDLQDVKNFIEIDSESGCKLLTEEFTGHMQKLLIKCKCGNEFVRDFKNFRNGSYYCTECKSDKLKKDRSKTHSQFLVDLYNVHQSEYIAIDKYINSYSKIKVKHNNQTCLFEWDVLPSSLLKGHGCPVCAGKFAKDTEFFINEIKNLVSDEYLLMSEYSGSNNHIVMKHNSCENEFITTPTSFLCGRRCPYCCNHNRIITTDIFGKDVSEISNGNYVLLSEYIDSRIKVKMKHNDCENTFDVTPTAFLSGSRCPFCSYKARKTTAIYGKELFDKTNGDYILIGEYVNDRTKVRVKHVRCESEYQVNPSSYLIHSGGCKRCSNNYTKTTEEVLKEVTELTSGRYVLIGDYVNGKVKTKFKHNDCGNIFEFTYHSFTRNKTLTQCPVCYGSLGESKVHGVLINNDINYQDQMWFDDCRNILPLPFDFAIFNNDEDLILLVEYDGEHHYKPIPLYGGELHFAETVKRDNIKNEYCYRNNIPLLRIPYWEYDNIKNILESELKKFNLIT